MPKYEARTPGRYKVEVQACKPVQSQRNQHWQTCFECDIQGIYDPQTNELEACNVGTCLVFVDWQMNDGTWRTEAACREINKAFGCEIKSPEDLHEDHAITVEGEQIDVICSHYKKTNGDTGEAWKLPGAKGEGMKAASFDDMKKAMRLAGKSSPKGNGKGKATKTNGSEIPF